MWSLLCFSRSRLAFLAYSLLLLLCELSFLLHLLKTPLARCVAQAKSLAQIPGTREQLPVTWPTLAGTQVVKRLKRKPVCVAAFCFKQLQSSCFQAIFMWLFSTSWVISLTFLVFSWFAKPLTVSCVNKTSWVTREPHHGGSPVRRFFFIHESIHIIVVRTVYYWNMLIALEAVDLFGRVCGLRNIIFCADWPYSIEDGT